MKFLFKHAKTCDFIIIYYLFICYNIKFMIDMGPLINVQMGIFVSVNQNYHFYFKIKYNNTKV
jgi:hypothetical protein